MSHLRVDIVGRVSTYTCIDLEAGLPLHAHAPNGGMEHDVFCESGSLIVFIHPNTTRTLVAGSRFKFDTTLWHGIYPLEVGTVFINTAQAEQPEFHSILESPHNAPEWALKA